MLPRAHRSEPRIVLFCGGRGSASIIRALLDHVECRLTLLVNGFDDGRSTGLVRRLVPGMLGPSDFRKNLVTVLDASSSAERALGELFELRLGVAVPLHGSQGLQGFVDHGDPRRLVDPLGALVSRVESTVRSTLRAYLRRALERLRSVGPRLSEDQVAIGNLVFAGVFLEAGNFDTAVKSFTRLARTRARIENVCDGAGRWLVALKADGQLLASESEIVGPQSTAPIVESYLLPQRLDAEAARALAPLSLRAKQAWLAARQVVAPPAEAALRALAQADLIVFGPGTQHSSLLPSYRILGAAIAQSPAVAKVLVVNLEPDHDDPGSTVAELIRRALCYLGDPENQRRSVTHALVDVAGLDAGGIDPAQLAGASCWRKIMLVRRNWRDPRRPDRHEGGRVARELTSLLRRHAEVRCEPVP